MVGLSGSAMDCMETPQSMPVNPDSVESNHWKCFICFRPLSSRSFMACTRSLDDASSVSAAILRHLSSPIPAEIPTPPIPARPQLLSRDARCSASMPQSFRSYLSRATSFMDDSWTPWAVIFTAMSEVSLLFSSSSRSE